MRLVLLALVLMVHADDDPRTSPTMKLSNGLTIPRVGYGCAGKASAKYVEKALRAGVRLIDTAQADEWYDEAAAADGLRASGVSREDVTVVTKLHPKNHGAETARRMRTLTGEKTAEEMRGTAEQEALHQEIL